MSDEKINGHTEEIYKWLFENIGNPVLNTKILLEIDKVDDYEGDAISWLYVFVEDGYKFYFRNKDDALLFKLTWG